MERADILVTILQRRVVKRAGFTVSIMTEARKEKVAEKEEDLNAEIEQLVIQLYLLCFLGRLGQGKPKNYSKAELARRRKRMQEAQKKRASKRKNPTNVKRAALSKKPKAEKRAKAKKEPKKSKRGGAN